MPKTYIVNAQVYTGHLFVEKTICMENGKIRLLERNQEPDFGFAYSETEADGTKPFCSVSDDGMVFCHLADGSVLFDGAGLKAVPGFIDIHTHGGAGVDVNHASKEDYAQLSGFFAANGTTSYLASVLTDTEEKTKDCIHAALEYMAETGNEADAGGAAEAANGSEKFDAADTVGAAELLGIHLEGPFLASEYKGAMPSGLLRSPDNKLLAEYIACAGGSIRYITVAPELAGAAGLISFAKENGIAVGIGHSGATYDEAKRGIAAGASIGTHVGNAMRLLHQHEPGVFGALIDSDCYCEIICDGRHLHPGTIRVLLKAKGAEGLIAITDSIMAAGLPDESYKLGANDIVVENGDAKLKEDGTRAGSTLIQSSALKNIMEYTGLSLSEALPILTENPAKAIGVFDRKGSIEDGKDADIVLLDNENNVACVFARGIKVKERVLGPYFPF